VQGQTDLLKIVRALCASGAFASALHRRQQQQQTDKNPNDRHRN
jgi:hypothetical protein